ncbi:MAG: L,D-transpeptidase family protein [Rhodobacterales bacterium]
MNRREFFSITASVVLFSGCAPKPKFIAYNGPKVTHIIVEKSSRNMWLMHKDKVLKKIKIDLGFEPVGHKQVEGDGRTPEGRYYINRRNPDSAYYLSLGLSYPNAQDRAKARAMGKSPGGDIFIHGGPNLSGDRNKPDWTAGCISISDKEIREAYSMVAIGTPINILP